MNRFLLGGCTAGLLFTACIGAQFPVITGATGSGLARAMNNNNNSVAPTPDGNLWAVVYDVDTTGGNGHLELRRSTDQGQTWSRVVDLPNNNSHNFHHNNSGNIVADRDGDKLHVTWADKAADPTYWSAMHQAFDVVNSTWIGTATLIAKGYGASNQFWPSDITITEKGTLVVCVSGHSGGGLGLGSWDCGLAILPRGGSFNATLINLRSGGASYSQNASICSYGEKIHCCMKNSTGGYGICYRSYDAETNSWDQTTQVYISPNNNSGIVAGNKSVIAVDSNNGVYIIYVTGSASAARTLRVAYAPPGLGSLNTDWQDIFVIPDTPTVGANYRSVGTTASDYPIIQGGNTTYRNYSLSPGPGGVMAAVYSKPFEDFTDLYVTEYTAGAVSTAEAKYSPPLSAPYSFEWVVGVRNGSYTGAASWLTFGKTDAPAPNTGAFPNGRVDIWSVGQSSARTISFGVACPGTMTAAPLMHARDTSPAMGTTYKLEFENFPPNTGFFMGAGPSMLAAPVELSFMNAPGCFLDIAVPVVSGLTSNASGAFTLPWMVPINPALFGVVTYAQCLVQPATGGPVTSNSVAIVIGT